MKHSHDDIYAWVINDKELAYPGNENEAFIQGVKLYGEEKMIAKLGHFILGKRSPLSGDEYPEVV